MPGINPWVYADKSGKEHAHQAALFMWANMAQNYGPEAADAPESYTVKGYAGEMLHAINSGEGRDPRLPQLKWLHAIHNQGHGDAIRGAKAKAEGVKAGVCDLFLPMPILYSPETLIPLALNVNYIVTATGKRAIAGLYLELKVGKNTPSEEQLAFMADMREAGYAADWAVGWLEARDKILAYLQISA